MAGVNDLLDLRKRIEQLKADKAKAEGALERVLEQLKSEFDCDSMEAAEAKLRKLQTKAGEAEAAFAKALTDFKTKHAEVLNG